MACCECSMRKTRSGARACGLVGAIFPAVAGKNTEGRKRTAGPILSPSSAAHRAAPRGQVRLSASFDVLEHVPIPTYIFRVVDGDFVFEGANGVALAMNPTIAI